jgi:hypothetical protein
MKKKKRRRRKRSLHLLWLRQYLQKVRDVCMFYVSYSSHQIGKRDRTKDNDKEKDTNKDKDKDSNKGKDKNASAKPATKSKHKK